MITQRTPIAIFTLTALIGSLQMGVALPARADDIVYSNFMAGNGTAQTGIQFFRQDGFPDLIVAMAFTVLDEPPIDYTLDRIELKLRLDLGENQADICIYSDLNGQPASRLECVSFDGQLPPGGPLGLLVGHFTGQTLLEAGNQYWVLAVQPNATESFVTWLDNVAGVEGLIGTLPGPGPFFISTGTQAAFRIVGTAVPPEDIRSAYSAYATIGPSGAPATVTLFPEVFCPGPGNDFFCPVQVTVPGFQSSAQVCQLLAEAINSLPGDSSDCSSDTPNPHGFSGACTGNVLRVANESSGVCQDAFVCADRAEGLDSFRRALSDEHLAVSGPLKLKLIGQAAGLTEDESFRNSIRVVHTRRCAPEFQPFTFTAEVPLTAGMQPDQVASQMAQALSANGDFDVVADGDKLVVQPPNCDGFFGSSPPLQGNFDLAVRINDRGLGFALTPLDEPFEILSVEPRPVCAEPPRAMVGWWHFDETSRAVVHDIARGNNGVRLNGTAQVPGIVGGALEFDGIDDWARVLDNTVLDFFASSDLSIDVWVRTDDAVGVRHLVDKRESAATPIGYSLFLADGRLGFQMGDRAGSNICSSDPSVSACTNFVSDVFVADGRWHLATVTVDRDDARGGQWYLDGQPIDRPFDPTIRDRSMSNSSHLAIGRRSFSATAHFRGQLDELEIFRRVLDPEEVRTLFEAGRAGKCKDPLSVPWDTPVCKDRQSAAAQLTVCNASSEPARYALDFQPIPAGASPDCNVDGPTVFRPSRPFDAPVVLPGASCTTVPVNIGRPAGTLAAGWIACYEASLINLDSGAVTVREGSLQDRPQVCTEPRRRVYGVPLDGFQPVRFDLTEIEVAGQSLDVVVEVFGPDMEPDREAVSLNGRPPGQVLDESLDVSQGSEAALDLVVSLQDFQPWTFYDLVVSSDLDADGDLDPLASTALMPESAGCVNGLNQLCLNEGRFRVEVDWRTPSGAAGTGNGVPVTGDSGQFWFFNESNVELGVKVLDGRTINGHFWVFFGALTNVEYTLMVTDTQTGARREYSNPLGFFASVGDTRAFSDAAAAMVTRTSTRQLSLGGTETEPHLLSHFAAYWERSGEIPVIGAATAGNCVSGNDIACLQTSRFRVDVSWRDFQGNTGVGQAMALTSVAGSFWFFNESNVELIAKVLDGRSINGHFWLFYGALSNVEYTITVTDTQTGELRTYFNPLGSFGSRADIGTF